ncbi:VOC family protein [Devosia lacusdianchii]|jgi:PhnB protein|uniref:VOC family protein n=1 Tax=Devosia lacusdianchii TaxID=2917991 RepID=UPI001F06F060|nr:glyoxalase/bleomycin resistance/extradiol dioxygenase family protein [Devosia sp. JXJ CY 41]
MTDQPATSGLTPYVNLNGVADAMAFYAKAFGAIERARNQMGSDNRIIHGHVEINGAPLFLSDFYPEHGFPVVTPQGYNLHLQVTDAQMWFDRAVAAGCTVVMPLKVEFWGDTYGQLRDPYGVTWAIGQSKQS